MPPFGTQLDDAPVLDDDLRVVEHGAGQIRAGGQHRGPRLRARDAADARLHGHIHESAGIRRLGRTIAINPGSDYATGALQGALVTLKDGGWPPTSWFAAEPMADTLVAVDVGTSGARATAFPRRGRAPAGGAPRLRNHLPRAGLGGAGPTRLAFRGHRALAGLVRQLGSRRPGGRHRPHRSVPIGLPGRPSWGPDRAGSDLSRQPGNRRSGGNPRAAGRCDGPRADRPPAAAFHVGS